MIFLSQGTSSTMSIGKHLGVHGAKFWDRSVRFQRAPTCWNHCNHCNDYLQCLQDSGLGSGDWESG